MVVCNTPAMVASCVASRVWLRCALFVEWSISELLPALDAGPKYAGKRPAAIKCAHHHGQLHKPHARQQASPSHVKHIHNWYVVPLAGSHHQDCCLATTAHAQLVPSNVMSHNISRQTHAVSVST